MTGVPDVEAPHDEARIAVVLGPCVPRWDDGACLAAINGLLSVAGYAVNVQDTVSLATGAVSIQELAERWYDRLALQPAPTLLVGNALGGAVAQILMSSLQPPHGTLLVSSPTVVDGQLSTRLGAVVDHARANRIEQALELHDSLVGSGRAGPRDATAGVQEAQRLVTGLALLRDLDLSSSVARHTGRVRHIVGASSLLVTADHVRPGRASDVVVVAGAGMRPHADAPEAVRRAVLDFLPRPDPGHESADRLP